MRDGLHIDIAKDFGEATWISGTYASDDYGLPDQYMRAKPVLRLVFKLVREFRIWNSGFTRFGNWRVRAAGLFRPRAARLRAETTPSKDPFPLKKNSTPGTSPLIIGACRTLERALHSSVAAESQRCERSAS